MKSRQKLKSLLAAGIAIAMLGCYENFALAAAADDATAGISGAAVAPAPPRLDFVFESHVNLGEFKLYGTYNSHKRGVMHLLGEPSKAQKFEAKYFHPTGIGPLTMATAFGPRMCNTSM